ncbi:MAG: DUF1287 domain-containing protein [Robiginitomaculum sp.]
MRYLEPLIVTAMLAFAAISIASPPLATADVALLGAAKDRLKVSVRYDGAYVRLAYPNGDVPSDTGVCTDVIIRSYRAAYDYDLQKSVHEDMAANFSAYPVIWGLTRTDKNIDHRRVPNLETFLTRQGAALTKSLKAEDYQPGDIVSWRLGGKLAHIGIVSDKKSDDGTPLIIHNIGAGPMQDDILFASPITGHFRFVPPVPD